MNLHCSLKTKHGRIIPEEDWDAVFTDSDAFLPFYRDDLRGELRITAEGQPDNVLVDNLLTLAQDFCLRAHQALTDGDAYAVDYWTLDGGLRLTPEADHVLIEGDLIVPARYSRSDFLSAQLDCARRLLAFFRRFAEHRHDFDASFLGFLEGLFPSVAKSQSR